MITCSGGDCPLKNSCHRYNCFNNQNTKPLINIPYNPNKKDCDEFWLLNASREEYKLFLNMHKKQNIECIISHSQGEIIIILANFKVYNDTRRNTDAYYN